MPCLRNIQTTVRYDDDETHRKITAAPCLGMGGWVNGILHRTTTGETEGRRDVGGRERSGGPQR